MIPAAVSGPQRRSDVATRAFVTKKGNRHHGFQHGSNDDSVHPANEQRCQQENGGGESV